MTRIIIIITLFFIGLNISSQNESFETGLDTIRQRETRNTYSNEDDALLFPTVFPPSPNVASLAMYSDIPNSHYTGTPNISIPLYEITTNGFKAPISISYHASGIKVNQEASWVGLGWALNAGGVITRQVRDKDDLTHPRINLETYPSYTNREILNFWGNEGQTPHDLEPDIYSFNFCGYSGKYILGDNLKPILYERGINFKIILHENADPYPYWEIYDENGICYIFKRAELTSTKTYTRYTVDTPKYNLSERDAYGKGESSSIISWYLTEIILPNQKKINFIYEFRASVSHLKSLNVATALDAEKYPYSTDTGIWSITSSHSDDYYLKEITWGGGKIEFITSERKDLYNHRASKLDKINIYNLVEPVPIKSYRFNYDYFNKSYLSSDDKLYPNRRLLYTRLKLQSLEEYSNQEAQGYRFYYNEEMPLPPKHSNDYDHWGYFNNRSSNPEDLFPKFNYDGIIGGVDRSCNPQTITLGMLTQIIYPTGGYSKFYYEPHEVKYPQFQDPVLVHNSNNYGKGGGVRIKRIETDKTIRDFDYNNSGRMLVPIQYTNWEIIMNREAMKDVYHILHYDSFTCIWNNSRYPLSCFKTGANVGYSYVKEDIVGDNNTSTIAYSFYNNTEEIIRENIVALPTIPFFSNGLPLSIDYLNNGNLVRSESFEYTCKKYNPIYAIRTKLVNVYNKYFYKAVVANHVQVSGSFPEDIVHHEIYELTPEWWQLTRKSVQESEVTTVTHYRYNETNFQPSYSWTETSDNKSLKTEYKYPHDINSVITSKMQDLHITSPVIEQIEYKDDQFFKKAVTEYKDWGNNWIAPEYIQVQTKSQTSPETRLIYHKYDDKGNPLYISKDNTINNVYLWGYNQQYPIAEIQNSNYDQVKNELTQELIDRVAKSNKPANSDLKTINNLRNKESLKNSLITTYTYKPLVGVMSITNPRNISTFYSYDTFNRLRTVRQGGELQASYAYKYKTQNKEIGGTSNLENVFGSNLSLNSYGKDGSFDILDANLPEGICVPINKDYPSDGFIFNWKLTDLNGNIITQNNNSDSECWYIQFDRTGRMKLTCDAENYLLNEFRSYTSFINPKIRLAFSGRYDFETINGIDTHITSINMPYDLKVNFKVEYSGIAQVTINSTEVYLRSDEKIRNLNIDLRKGENKVKLILPDGEWCKISLENNIGDHFMIDENNMIFEVPN